VLEDSYHMITIDRERREVIRRSARFFSDIGERAGVLQAVA